LVNSSWRDLDVHGRRLNKILKILDKKFDKVPKDDIDGLARIAATIGNVTRQTIEIIKIVDRYEEINEHFTEIEKQKKQRELQARKWRREVEENERIEFENQKQREKNEIHEEVVARRQGEKQREELEL